MTNNQLTSGGGGSDPDDTDDVGVDRETVNQQAGSDAAVELTERQKRRARADPQNRADPEPEGASPTSQVPENVTEEPSGEAADTQPTDTGPTADRQPEAPETAPAQGSEGFGTTGTGTTGTQTQRVRQRTPRASQSPSLSTTTLGSQRNVVGRVRARRVGRARAEQDAGDPRAAAEQESGNGLAADIQRGAAGATATVLEFQEEPVETVTNGVRNVAGDVRQAGADFRAFQSANRRRFRDSTPLPSVAEAEARQRQLREGTIETATDAYRFLERNQALSPGLESPSGEFEATTGPPPGFGAFAPSGVNVPAQAVRASQFVRGQRGLATVDDGLRAGSLADDAAGAAASGGGGGTATGVASPRVTETGIVLGAAGVGAFANEQSDFSGETVREQGELPVEEATREQNEVRVPEQVDRGELPLDEALGDQRTEVRVPEGFDRSEFTINRDGTVDAPAQFTGNVVVQRQRQREEGDEQVDEDDVIVNVPDEFIPDDEVTIGETDGSVDQQADERVRQRDEQAAEQDDAVDESFEEEIRDRDQQFQDDTQAGDTESGELLGEAQAQRVVEAAEQRFADTETLPGQSADQPTPAGAASAVGTRDRAGTSSLPTQDEGELPDGDLPVEPDAQQPDTLQPVDTTPEPELPVETPLPNRTLTPTATAGTPSAPEFATPTTFAEPNVSGVGVGGAPSPTFDLSRPQPPSNGDDEVERVLRRFEEEAETFGTGFATGEELAAQFDEDSDLPDEPF